MGLLLPNPSLTVHFVDFSKRWLAGWLVACLGSVLYSCLLVSEHIPVVLRLERFVDV